VQDPKFKLHYHQVKERKERREGKREEGREKNVST
jgi:hypothetical protein